MCVDVHIARTAKREVEAAIARHLLEHVVEERQPGSDLDSPAALQDDLRRQLRLLALPRDLTTSTQVAPPPHVRGRSVLPGPPAAPSHRAASLDRRGSPSRRCSPCVTFTRPTAT